MKKILLLILLAVISVSSVAAEEAGIVWEKDFNKAQQTARMTGKPLLLDFTASWCQPCQVMEKEFWVREDIIDAMKSFVAVKLNFDKETRLVNKYKVQVIPYIAFADPLGNMITFKKGYSSETTGNFMQIFNEMPKNFETLLPIYDALDVNNQDSAALLKIADTYRSARMLLLSNDFYKRALKTPEIQKDAVSIEKLSIVIATNYYGAADYENAAKYLTDFLKNFPQSKNREIAIFALTISNANRKKFKEAEENLKMFQTEFPSSSKIAQAAAEIEKARKKK